MRHFRDILKTSAQLLIIFKSKRTKQVISMHFHIPFFFTSSIDGICNFLLPYDFHHNMCSVYFITTLQILQEPNNDNFCFLSSSQLSYSLVSTALKIFYVHFLMTEIFIFLSCFQRDGIDLYGKMSPFRLSVRSSKMPISN